MINVSKAVNFLENGAARMQKSILKANESIVNGFVDPNALKRMLSETGSMSGVTRGIGLDGQVVRDKEILEALHGKKGAARIMSQKDFNGYVLDAYDAQRLGHMKVGDNGKLRYSKARLGTTIAGSYMGLSAAGRIVTGGGIYKDKDGNTDFIGIPFI